MWRLSPRSGSGATVDSFGKTLASPTAENWDSSDSDSESSAAEQARVISPKERRNRGVSERGSRGLQPGAQEQGPGPLFLQTLDLRLICTAIKLLCVDLRLLLTARLIFPKIEHKTISRPVLIYSKLDEKYISGLQKVSGNICGALRHVGTSPHSVVSHCSSGKFTHPNQTLPQKQLW